MKRTTIVSGMLATIALTPPILSFAVGNVGNGVKLVELKADSSLVDVQMKLKGFANDSNPELLDIFGRLESPDGILPGTISFVVQNGLEGQQAGKVGMVYVQPKFSGIYVGRISPSPDPQIYRRGLVSLQYVRGEGRGTLVNLQRYVKEEVPTRGLDGVYERIKSEHAAPLADDFIPRPHEAFDEGVVGISGSFNTILKAGEKITFPMSKAVEIGQLNYTAQHDVTLTKGYKMQATPATWRQILAVMPELKNIFYSLKLGPGGLDYPAVLLSWNDVQSLLKRIGEETGRYFDLPTEAQWQNAAHGGMPSGFRFFFGNDERRAGEYARYFENANRQLTAVATKRLNPYGLDIIGNVRVWTRDLYGDYPKEAVTNPMGPTKGAEEVQYQVVRGGDRYTDAEGLESTFRGRVDPDLHPDSVGLRLVTPSVP